MAANITLHPNSTWIGTAQMWHSMTRNASNIDLHPGATVMILPGTKEDRDAWLADLAEEIAERIADRTT